MKDEIEKAIKALTAKITGDVKAGDALQFTQSALNLVHVLVILYNMKEKA